MRDFDFFEDKELEKEVTETMKEVNRAYEEKQLITCNKHDKTTLLVKSRMNKYLKNFIYKDFIKRNWELIKECDVSTINLLSAMLDFADYNDGTCHCHDIIDFQKPRQYGKAYLVRDNFK